MQLNNFGNIGHDWDNPGLRPEAGYIEIPVIMHLTNIEDASQTGVDVTGRLPVVPYVRNRWRGLLHPATSVWQKRHSLSKDRFP